MPDTWENLSQEKKDVVNTFERELRGIHGKFQQLLNAFDRINIAYNAQVSSIFSVDLNTAELVPNSSGLAGSQSLTTAEMISLVSHMQGALTTYATTGHENLRDKAAGTVNMSGEPR